MTSTMQAGLFDIEESGNPLDSNLKEQINYQNTLDLKEAKKWGNLQRLVIAPAKKLAQGKIKEILSNLRRTKEYPIRAYSSMNQGELCAYYAEVREDIRNSVVEAEDILSLRQYPEHLMY
jgi:hypothetical protein